MVVDSDSTEVSHRFHVDQTSGCTAKYESASDWKGRGTWRLGTLINILVRYSWWTKSDESINPKNQLGPSKRRGFDSLFGRVLLDLQITSFEIPCFLGKIVWQQKHNLSVMGYLTSYHMHTGQGSPSHCRKDYIDQKQELQVTKPNMSDESWVIYAHVQCISYHIISYHIISYQYKGTQQLWK